MWFKKIIILVIIVLLAIVAFNLITKGKRSSLAQSPEEQRLARLVEDFQRMRAKLNEVNAAGGLGGIDMSAEIDAAFREVARIEGELTALKGHLTSESAIEKAERLQNNIAAFKKSMR